MMKLLHLYHDLMNLYGDYANIAALQRILEKNGETVQVDKKTLGDAVRLCDYDFVFIGSGTERNLRVALADFRRYADDLKAYIDSGKPALLTGNAFEMLGKTLTDARGETVDGLGLFDFTVTEQNKTRVTADVIYECAFLTQPLVGFINRCSEISGTEPPVFTVKMGVGNAQGDSGEGVRRKNLLGTHLTGPALIKNPHLLLYFAQLLLGKTPQGDSLVRERAGYEITLEELTKRMNAQ